jgi:hypothetical protein
VSATQTASASQSTSIGGGFIGGTGNVAAVNTGFDASGPYSQLYTQFALDETYTAHLFATLIGDQYTQTGLSSIYGTLYFKQGSGIADFTTVLTPGTYNFSLVTSVGLYDRNDFSGTASFDGGLTLTPLEAAPVPEPATMTMLGLGLAAASAKRWRARRANNGGVA